MGGVRVEAGRLQRPRRYQRQMQVDSRHSMEGKGGGLMSAINEQQDK